MGDEPDRDFQLAMATLADNQTYIAAHKERRWDVVKWAFSINLALATASAFKSGESRQLSFFLFLIGMGVSGAGIFLVRHLNERMTETRNRAQRVAIWLDKHNVDWEGIVGVKADDMYPKGGEHDFVEIRLADAVLLLVPFLSLARVVFGPLS